MSFIHLDDFLRVRNHLRQTIQAEYASARASIRQLRDGLKQSRLDLDKICAEKSQLVENYAKKVLKK